MRYNRKIILEDGQEYYGYSFGHITEKVCEVVFNTSMVGYQEIISDPSYTYQAVVMTYPLIGNYGMNYDDYETKVPTIGALIVREYNDEPSNYRSTATLSEIMKKYKIPGVSGVDTRKLTRSIRDHGSRKALITSASTPVHKGLEILKANDIPTNAVSVVSCGETWVSAAETEKYHVVAIDCGMKMNIVRSLNRRGCKVTVVPWDTDAGYIERLNPDGILISNGPGDPEHVPQTIATVKSLIGKYPIFGICLGHQIISLAYGAKTYKMKFGHHGANHPVRNLETNKIEITSQNHSYAVDTESLAGTALTVTHINLLDHTVEGVKCEKDKVFAVQYHPESAPGPNDSAYLFDCFVNLMQGEKDNA
ncbi:MAG: glutamine-hydrolyzing carbamoyl-phosphate synthase small subunit [Clostridiaceae bacterium]|nr:glutamine-hydrolyzing carbamoyl-phosphate synthase small subunit [Clostridiaceae bacterium]